MPDEISPATISLETIAQSLDVLVLLELAIISYFDNSVALLILRLTVYVSFVAPRPASATPNPQTAPVLLSAFLCFFIHLLAAAPSSVEAGSHGYLHGATLVDFVGELGPISKWRLIFLDILITLLQLGMLALAWEKAKLNGRKDGDDVVQDTQQQDLEAEEAGVRNSRDGIELQDQSAREDAMGSHPTDKFYTSEYIAIELDVVRSLRGLASSTPLPSSTAMDDGGVIGSILARMAHRP